MPILSKRCLKKEQGALWRIPLAQNRSVAGDATPVPHAESYADLIAAGAKPLRFADEGSLLWPYMVHIPQEQKKFKCKRNHAHLEKKGLRGKQMAFGTLEECQVFMASCGLFPKDEWWDLLEAWLLER